ncbi:cilia- and flagella-associated protein 70-like [Prorops nasuta]|uniref:cilia- and flagella-associated protein 70-like n=1 Tax=Prorops nasuta TaxID=863751 RepID=UPI0034CDCADF
MENVADSREMLEELEKEDTELSSFLYKPKNCRTIFIFLEMLENIISDDVISVFFSVEHDGEILGKSEIIVIDSSEFDGFDSEAYDINYSVEMEMNVDSLYTQNLVSKPIIELDVAIWTCCQYLLVNVNKLIYIFCDWNYYLINGNLGEKSFKEKIPLENPVSTFDSEAVSWQNLPLLTFKVFLEEDIFFPSSMSVNYLTITVESIYNLPPSWDQTKEYKIATVVHIDQNIRDNVIFEGGSYKTHAPLLRTCKIWQCLINKLQGRALLSRYKVDNEYQQTRNIFKDKFDLEKEVNEKKPRIQWNAISRFIMFDKGISSMKEHILKYAYWPFQIAVTGNSDGKTKNSHSQVELYQCCVDLSELLFPGGKYFGLMTIWFLHCTRTQIAQNVQNEFRYISYILMNRTRVVAKLEPFIPSDLFEKTGMNYNIFQSEEQSEEYDFKDKKSISKVFFQLQGVTMTFVKTLQDERGDHFEQLLSNRPWNHGASNYDLTLDPTMIQNSQATYIVIQVELHHPLFPSKVEADFSHLIENLTSPKKQKKPYLYTNQLAEELYTSCIKKLAEIIIQNYQGEINRFIQYLIEKGVDIEIFQSLKSKVLLLLNEKFSITKDDLTSTETQKLISSIYTRLTKQMETTLNEMVESKKIIDNNHIPMVDIYYYAEEAYELGLDAKHYHLTAISENNADPRGWLEYGIYLLKRNEIERSIECCRKALAIEKHYRLALLLYGGILLKKKQYTEAEVCFCTVTKIYPRFAEGWSILHLFYLKTQYLPGIHLTSRNADKCINNKERDIEPVEKHPDAWSDTFFQSNNIYSLTAVLLFRLHLLELAGIAISEEISRNGYSLQALYYLAIEHYLSRRYEDAISHLKKARSFHGLDFSIASLMGHCFYQLGDIDQAIFFYEFSNSYFSRPDDAHLLHIRMGIYYESIGNFERATKMFLMACKSSPTPQSWLGLGKTFYSLHQLRQAEMCLLEANDLDHYNPDIWGYLSLINLSQKNYDEFHQCYLQAIKNKLNNKKLSAMISSCMEKYGLDTKTGSIYETEQENEEIDNNIAAKSV